MKKVTVRFSSAKTDFYFDANFSHLRELVDKKNAVIITDEKVFMNHAAKFTGWNMIVLKSGEENKSQDTIDAIIDNLIEMEAVRKTILDGAGGYGYLAITGYCADILSCAEKS